MSDINLLPDNLKGEESKLKAGSSTVSSVSFHIPSKEEIPVRTEPPKAPVPVFKKETARQDFTAPKLKKPVSPVKVKKAWLLRGLFGGKGRDLSGKLESEPDKPFGVNLIPAGSYLIASKKIYLYLIISCLSALLVLSLALLAVAFLKQNISRTEQEIEASLAQGQKTYEALKAKEAEAIKWSRQVEMVKNLMAKHIYWTRFFDELERLTLPEVYYSSIDASVGGEVALTASSDTYTNAARQYLVFQRAEGIINQAEISGLSSDGQSGSVSFQALLKMADDIYFSF